MSEPEIERQDNIESVKQLRFERGVLKARLTRFENFLSKTENLKLLEQIEVRLTTIQNDFSQFESIQTRLEYLVNQEVEEREILEERFYSVISQANHCLHTQETRHTEITQSLMHQTENSQSTFTKLPDIELPNFHGTYDTWLSFFDVFQSLVHNRSDLSNIQKFLYLKTCCKGNANTIIDSLKVSSENYMTAIELLKKRFENKRAIINHHINTLLFNLPVVTKDSSLSLRRLVDTINQHIKSLTKLELPTQHWDLLLIPLIIKKLDFNTRHEWENKQNNNHLPQLNDLLEFLTKKCCTLEVLYSEPSSFKTFNSLKESNTLPKFRREFNSSKPIRQSYFSINNAACQYCKGKHFIYQCVEFGKLSISDKYKEIVKLKLCNNCLRPGHTIRDCRSQHCKKCSEKHNTLLHDESKSYEQDKPQTLQVSNIETNVNSQSGISGNIIQPIPSTSKQATDNKNDEHTTLSFASVNINQVLLSTALILVQDNFGRFHECIALLDSGSQSNFISQKLAEKLQLPLQQYSLPISGINQNLTQVNNKLITKIRSHCTSYEADLTFLVLPSITERLPLVRFDKKIIHYPQQFILADERFNEPKNVDVLIGAEIFYELLDGDSFSLGKNLPTLHKTKLGWIVTGTLSLSNNTCKVHSICNFARNISKNKLDDLNLTLQKFWLVEDFPQKRLLTSEEQFCENLFQNTTTRDEAGRFIVRLPIKNESKDMLGDSKTNAIRRFQYLENRLNRNVSLNNSYKEFMQEYVSLNHMTDKGTLKEDIENDAYFLPHHAVIRESSSTTKCRVVFDGSAKSTSGYSLNDILCVGPTIQDELFAIILRLRLRKYVLNADIKMMYRQIWIHPRDRKYQKIIWRFNPDSDIHVYELNTLTYGHSSSPFLATRCLKQLASEFSEIYPRTSKIIENSFYMDDLLISVNTIEEAIQIYNEITEIMASAGFQLRKWSSNEPILLQHIVDNNNENDPKFLQQENKVFKTLGIVWDCQKEHDSYNYSVNLRTTSTHTKRSVLSIVSQVFDPLGLVAPAVVKAKIFLQKLWQSSIDWDDELSPELLNQWNSLQIQFEDLNMIHIPRHIIIDRPKFVKLVGFCDASEKAYGACLYLVSTDISNKTESQLLCSKSRVAPLKKLTLPRLELLAAVLLAKLTKTVKEIMDIHISKTTYFSDSTIVLSWLHIDLPKLKTFVANRIALIRELTNINDWKHVRSELNAADMISRGVPAKVLLDMEIWWHGPEFLLQQNPNRTPCSSEIKLDLESLPEIKNCNVSLPSFNNHNFLAKLINDCSTLNKLQRTVAYVLRFKRILLLKQRKSSVILNTEELRDALTLLLKLVQRESFSSEISALTESRKLDKHSKIINLNPFLDTTGLLRVGGRLSNSDLPYDQKHPIILPYKNRFTELVVQNAHLKYLHVGTQNLLSILRLKYWLVNAKNMVKSVIRSCVKCFKNNPKPMEFLMGNLPRDRVVPSRPFLKCGVDYAGPILIKEDSLRKAKLVKSYICIFVCFAVRAIHIELVMDLTTDGFLNALKRFISRRGKPSDIFSDNGLNFLGAKNHFSELYKLLSDTKHNENVSQFLANDEIKWHFIPPKSPHTGGLWEAAVKSTKYHLRRILGNAIVSFDEMYTVLTQIEACLNSRPLTSLSDDPNDFLPLTPSHFLIGDSLSATPQADVHEEPSRRLSRYQRLQQLVQQFWRRWSREYLSQLQKRSKWNQRSEIRPRVGSLVLLVEDNQPPLRWPMARIVELHPGADEVIRTVSVKTANGSVMKRSLRKICSLPIDNNH